MGAIKRTFGFILNHPLAARHMLNSLGRFIAWQVQSRLRPSRFYIKNFIFPVRFYARQRLTGITGNIYTGLHEFADMGFLLHFLREGDDFYDIGANVGAYTLLASGIRKAQSIAMEPVPEAFGILKKNVELNQLQNNVQLINAGAGSKKGNAVFTSNEDTTNHITNETGSASAKTITVAMQAVDDLFDGSKVSLIKIDVEGYETEVLAGMEVTLNSPGLKAIIIELNGSGLRYGFEEKAIHNLLLMNGFISCIYNPFTRNLSPSESFGNYNTIYCRDIAMVTERLKTANPVRVMGEVI
jgi:FkbM family methyltransferase